VLAIDDSGDGAPVVLLHGLTATKRYVVMGSKALERSGHRVVAYDARGHGASDPAPARDAYAYADLVDDLLAVLDERGIDRAVLAGASMGAHTVIGAALRAPERVAGLVVITPAFDPEGGGNHGQTPWAALSEGLRTGGIDGFVAAYDLGSLPEGFRGTVETVLRQRMAQHEHLGAVADALDVVPRSRPFERWEDLREIEAPAIVVASRDEADPTHPFATAERYARELRAELVTEEEGKSPLAWQGGQLSRVIAGLAERA
jgi:pimeloyl-ACP methyl ester carboxylesterase